MDEITAVNVILFNKRTRIPTDQQYGTPCFTNAIQCILTNSSTSISFPLQFLPWIWHQMHTRGWVQKEYSPLHQWGKRYMTGYILSPHFNISEKVMCWSVGPSPTLRCGFICIITSLGAIDDDTLNTIVPDMIVCLIHSAAGISTIQQGCIMWFMVTSLVNKLVGLVLRWYEKKESMSCPWLRKQKSRSAHAWAEANGKWSFICSEGCALPQC